MMCSNNNNYQKHETLILRPEHLGQFTIKNFLAEFHFNYVFLYLYTEDSSGSLSFISFFSEIMSL